MILGLTSNGSIRYEGIPQVEALQVQTDHILGSRPCLATNDARPEVTHAVSQCRKTHMAAYNSVGVGMNEARIAQASAAVRVTKPAQRIGYDRTDMFEARPTWLGHHLSRSGSQMLRSTAKGQ